MRVAFLLRANKRPSPVGLLPNGVEQNHLYLGLNRKKAKNGHLNLCNYLSTRWARKLRTCALLLRCNILRHLWVIKLGSNRSLWAEQGPLETTRTRGKRPVPPNKQAGITHVQLTGLAVSVAMVSAEFMWLGHESEGLVERGRCASKHSYRL